MQEDHKSFWERFFDSLGEEQLAESQASQHRGEGEAKRWRKAIGLWDTWHPFEEYLDPLPQKIAEATSWPELQFFARWLLGTSSFYVGVATGMVKGDFGNARSYSALVQ